MKQNNTHTVMPYNDEGVDWLYTFANVCLAILICFLLT